jgi:hypothetical protein
MVSSTLTLLVFFPRSKSQEAGYNPREASTTMHPHSLPASHRSSMRSMHSFSSKDASRLSLGFDATSPISPVVGAEDDVFMPGARVSVSERGHHHAHAHHLHFRTEPSTPAGNEFPVEGDDDVPRLDEIRDAMQMHELGPSATRQRRPRPRSAPGMPTGSGLHPFVCAFP